MGRRIDNIINYNEIPGWSSFSRSEKHKYYTRAYRLRDPIGQKEKRSARYDNNIDEIRKKYNENYYLIKDNKNQKARESYDPLKKSEYYQKHKEHYRDYFTIYRTVNQINLSKKHRKYIRNRYKHDILFRVKRYIATSICNSFRYINSRKNTNTSDILGMTTSEFKLYLESKFKPWMNWDNKGLHNGKFNYGWDIDHIIPISTASCTKDIIRLNHYTNLQPLCSHINRDLKKDKINFNCDDYR